MRAYAKGDATAGLAAVREMLRRYRAPAWEARARVLAASHLARDGRDREIIDFLPGEVAGGDPLATHAMLLRARGFLARGANDRAAELAARAASAAGFPAVEEAQLTRAHALEASGAWREALRVLDAVNTPTAAIEAGRSAAAHGDSAGEGAAWSARCSKPVATTTSTGFGRPSRRPSPMRGSRLSASERPRLVDRARQRLEDGHAKTAVDLLRLVRPAGAPSTATGAEALVEAEALLKLGRVAEMGPLLVRARQADPASSDGARYLEARRAAFSGNAAAYRIGLESVARRAASPWQERALLDAARAGEGAPQRQDASVVPALSPRRGDTSRPVGALAGGVGRLRSRTVRGRRCGVRRRPGAARCPRRRARHRNLLEGPDRRCRRPHGGSARRLRHGRRRFCEPLLRSPRGETAGSSPAEGAVRPLPGGRSVRAGQRGSVARSGACARLDRPLGRSVILLSRGARGCRSARPGGRARSRLRGPGRGRRFRCHRTRAGRHRGSRPPCGRGHSPGALAPPLSGGLRGGVDTRRAGSRTRSESRRRGRPAGERLQPARGLRRGSTRAAAGHAVGRC